MAFHCCFPVLHQFVLCKRVLGGDSVCTLTLTDSRQQRPVRPGAGGSLAAVTPSPSGSGKRLLHAISLMVYEGEMECWSSCFRKEKGSER